jgi:predicted nucleic-acid-binding protein
MAAPFLDTNILIRFVTQDDPALAQQAAAIFQRCETGSAEAELTEGVLVEAVQVLSSKRLYNLPRRDIQFHLTNIVNLQGIKLRPKSVYRQALQLYAANNVDFVDALLAVKAVQRGSQVLSFDQGFDHLRGVTRVTSI